MTKFWPHLHPCERDDKNPTQATADEPQKQRPSLPNNSEHEGSRAEGAAEDESDTLLQVAIVVEHILGRTDGLSPITIYC